MLSDRLCETHLELVIWKSRHIFLKRSRGGSLTSIGNLRAVIIPNELHEANPTASVLKIRIFRKSEGIFEAKNSF